MTVEIKFAASEAALGADVVAGDLALLAGLAAAAILLAPAFGIAAVGAAGAAAAFTITSAGAWIISNEYAALALDPPRDDYHLVARFKPRNVELSRAAGEIETTWNEFSRTQIELADALAALTISFERLGGARLDLRKLGANADLLAHRITTQRQAIRYNAVAAKRRIHVLISLRRRVNATWRADADRFRASAELVSRTERERALANFWPEITPALRSALGSDLRLSKIQSLIEQAALTNLSVPDVILDDRWNTVMLDMGKRLAILAGERRLTLLRQELG